MTLLVLGLVLAAGAFAFTLPAHKVGAKAPPALLLLVYLAPAVFLLLTLHSVKDDVRLRFALLGLGFKGPATSTFDVDIGGDRDGHAIWISAYDDGETVSRREEGDRRRRLQEGALIVTPAAGEESRAAIALAPSTRPSPGLLGWKRGGRLQPVRALELEDGDIVVIAGRRWQVEHGGPFGAPASFVELLGAPAEPSREESAEGDVDQADASAEEGAASAENESAENESASPAERGETATGARVDIPARFNELPVFRVPLPVLRPAPPSLATYPVAWLEQAAGGVRSSTVESFFYLVPGRVISHRLFLAVGADAVRVERGGERLEVPSELDLPRGERLHALGRPRWDGEEFQAGGIRDLRSFRLQTSRRGLTAAYDTPEIFALPWSDLVELSERVRSEDGGEKLRVHLSMGGQQLTDRSLYFRHASLPVALESLAILEFPVEVGASTLATGETFTAATPRGQVRGRFGEALWLGEEHLAAIQIDRIEPPLALGVLALLLALLKTVAARAVRLSLPLALAAATLETLVALRLLLGFQAWALPPFKEEPYALAVDAWMALPWAFLAAAFPIRDRFERHDLGRTLVVGSGLVLSLVVCIQVAGGGFATLLWIALHLGAAAVPVARHFDLFERLAEVADRLLEPGPENCRALLTWCAVACVPTLLRAVLLGLGFRESLQLGRRIALSLVHVPLAIVLQALFLLWLWRHLERDGTFRLRVLWPIPAFLGGTWVAPALIVSDLGLALLNLPVFLLALAALLVAAHGRLDVHDGDRGRLRLVTGVVTLLLVLLVLPLGARLVVGAIELTSGESLYSERNYLRLLDFADPDRLEGVARKASEELAVMSAVLRSYTTASTGAGGRGYLATEVSPHLRSTALREHVPAVFIAAQWGWAGATGLVLVLLIIAGAGLALLPHRLPEDDVTRELRASGLFGTLAGLAALTVALPSLYMLLANYRLALFTGKNAYLLGLDSTADVLEACLLLLITAAGAAAVRDRS